MRVYLPVFATILAFTISSGCAPSSTEISSTNKTNIPQLNQNTTPLIQEKAAPALQAKDTYIDTSELPTINKVSENDANSSFKVPFSIQEYQLEHPDFRHDLIAPQFVNEDYIIFDMNPSGSNQASIGLFDRTTKKYKKIYLSPKKTIINTLVGINDTLFWVEYEKQTKKDRPWKIMSYDLKNKKTYLVKKGISDDGTSVPILTNTDKYLTWIEYELKNQIMWSRAMLYDPVIKETKIIAEAKLDETKGRNGHFFAIQRPSDNGMLIHESVYTKTSANESKKTYQIKFYPYDMSSSIYLLDGKEIIDYVINKNWFVWTEEGKVTVASMHDGKIKYQYFAESEKLTNDTPYIVDHYLFYRYGINQIYIVDLNTGKRQKFSKDIASTSKIFNSEDYLFFGQWEPSESTGRAKFHVIDLSK
ncbi:hypothetical protein P4V43_27105 [Brevibacillus fortis]|uniref:DUF5050 domain-containing protein n=1 Tax=Brevibacillus fortis TaxID=2126352 RepID=A0A2P7V672_9BACL|nr:hypothetical protein [Brevibacillus fortis]MED1785496.1 hypothetical protein [Brevibacillus fortis]PSJ94722.1 hypothetical protein C7R93_15160 [Brevibacillus fortis]